ncbi:MAG TPA: uracil-DNA glycosylase [Nitrososphaera sp.]|jgi:uracil-DNA glycosylase family 4|nr:uracil-DNA glycosylase [Nitrososphaera sp.]
MGTQKHEDSLEKIASDVRGCPLCELARTRKNAVPGEGQLSAKVMFIGEAPGRREDEKGRPFVGAAGRILDNLLKNVGIERSQVFITNIVKCRPPNNRVPKEDEMIACRPYLDRQIELIKPKVICILGRTAHSSILGGSSITANRGKIVERSGQKYFSTFHPASVIYNKSLLSALEADLKKLAAEINKEEDSKGSMEDYL